MIFVVVHACDKFPDRLPETVQPLAVVAQVDLAGRLTINAAADPFTRNLRRFETACLLFSDLLSTTFIVYKTPFEKLITLVKQKSGHQASL